MKSVEEICDRVVLIHQSKKVAEGKLSELQEERKLGLYAVRFRGSMIAFVNALWTGFEVVDKQILGDDRFEVSLKMRGENSFDDLLNVLIGQVKMEAAWEVLPSMQDVFIEIVQTKKEIEDEK
jgi:ABC-2 type transport system ATP-binding protein